MKSTSTARPWGTEDLFVQNKPVTVKFLNVRKGESLSLQYHHHRDEFWRVVSGKPELIIGEETITAEPGQEFFVSAEMHHRITAPHDDVTILEISTGEFDQDDIVRLEDKYNRLEK